MKKCLALLGTILIWVIAPQTFATNLIDVYRQALVSDPTFKAANYQWLAARENLPISRANLLPVIGLNSDLNRSYNKTPKINFDGLKTTSKFYDNEAQYALNLTQPVFNFGYWANLFATKASVKAAEATYFSSAQDLMLRVATAYFNVLQSSDILNVTQAQKKAIAEQLRQTQQRYKVGLVAITDLNDAQANYDSIIASEIAAKNDLADKIEQLRAITDRGYKELDVLAKELQLLKPHPANIDQWVTTAEKQNYSLLAARYTTIAARENISEQRAGHFPIINLNGEYNNDYNSQSSSGITTGRDETTLVGVTIDMPIYHGGQVVAKTRQAQDQYQQSIQLQEQTHRSVVSSKRQFYLGVISGINKIIAYKQTVISKESKLRSTLLSYSAGLRTMVDVLQAQTDLYDAQKTYTVDKYNYLIETINLKYAAGTLSPNDLAKINSWLKRVDYNNIQNVDTKL